MTPDTRFFLVVFDRDAAEPLVEDLGPDATAAIAAYESREHELAERPEVEVALLRAPSIDTLRQTHSSYFGAGESLRAALAP